MTADLILDGRPDVARRTLRHPRLVLAGLVLVAVALFAVDQWLQAREFAQLTDRINAAQQAIDYADSSVNGALQYGTPSLFMQSTPAGVRDYLRGLVTDASATGATDIAAAQAGVAGVALLPWHRSLIDARDAFVRHAQAWQVFLHSDLPSRAGANTASDQLAAGRVAAIAALRAARPLVGDAARVDAIFAAQH